MTLCPLLVVCRQTTAGQRVAGLDAVVFPSEGDGPGVGADQATVRGRDAVSVAAETGQHRLGATERGLGIDHPFGFAERGEPRSKGLCLGEPRQVAEEGKSAGAMQGQQTFDEQTPELQGHNPDAKE
jgi:hypothetical protein